MKKSISIFLLLLIFFQTFSSFVVQIDFIFNESYIAKVLCINRAKPEKGCNGKCYLAKKIAEQEEKENQTTQLQFDKYEPQNDRQNELPEIVFVPIESSTQRIFNSSMYQSDFLHAIFHPPAFLLSI